MSTHSSPLRFAQSLLVAACALQLLGIADARADTITATATNAANGQPTLNITAQGSRGYGVGYIYIVDGAQSPLSSVGWPSGAVTYYWVGWSYTNPVNSTWTDPRPVYGKGSKTYTVYAETYQAGINPSGWGYVATTVTANYNITNNPTGANLVLSAANYTLVYPAQPAFHIAVSPLTRTNPGDGSTQQDYLTTAYIDIPGSTLQALTISNPYATFNANFTDPRGALNQITPITYHVRIYGAEMVPNSRDNYDPDTGDYIDTDYWFDWNWHDIYTADISFQFTDPRATQSITFANPGPHTFGDGPFALAASSSSGLPISFLVSGPAYPSGSTLTITGAGSVAITAKQNGNASYQPAPDVVQSFTVSKGTPTVTFADPGPFPSSTAYNIASVVSSNSNGAITFSVTSGNATIGAGLISINGTAVIRATVAATTNWNSAYAERTITSTAGLTNSMSAIATNALNQNPAFAITATSIGSTSNGYYVVYVYDNGQDPGTVSNGSWVPGGYIDNFSVAWTGQGVFHWNWSDKRALFGQRTKTYTFLAMSLWSVNPSGWGYNGTTATSSYAISGNPTGGNIVLSAASTNLASPAQPGFHIAVTPKISYTDDGQWANDYIYITRIDVPGYGTVSVTNPGYPNGAVSMDFADPRGVLTGNQNVTYHVHIYGVQMVPYADDVYDSDTGDYLYTNYGFNANWIDPLYQADISFQLTDSRTAQTITLANPGQQTYGSAPIALSASASSGLPVTLSVISGLATISGSTLTLTGVGSVTVKASQAGNASYQAAPDVTQTFTVVKGTPSVTFSDPGAIPFNAATSLAGFVSSSAPATNGWTWSVMSGSATVDAGGNVLVTGPAVIRATVNATANSNSAYAERSLLMGNASPIQLALQYWQPNDAPYTTTGTAYSYNSLRNQAAYDAGPSTWYLYNVYQPNGVYYGQAWNWNILQWYTVTTYTPVDSGHYGASWTSSKGSFQIGSGAAAFSSSPGRGNVLNTYNPGDTFSFTPFGYAPSGNLGALSWRIIDPSNNVLQSGAISNYSGSYNTGANVKQVLSQNGLYQIVLSYSGATATGSDPSAASVTYNLPVGVVPPTVTFTVPVHTMGDAPFNLTSSSTGPGSPTYTIVSQTPNDGSASGMLTISGNTVTLAKAGTAVIAANYPASAPWIAGTTSASLQVLKCGQNISFPAIPSHTFGDAPLALSATASSGLAPSYSIISGPATVSGSSVTLTGAGTVVIQASQAGNSNYLAATSVTTSFAVNPSSQTITFPAIPTHSYGDVVSLGATSNSNLPVSYVVISGPATVSGSSLTVTGVGSITVQASQAGNGNFLAAANSSQTFTATPACQIITLGGISAHGFGDVFTLSGSSSSGLPVTFAVVSGPATISGSVLTVTGLGTIVVSASQPGTGNFAAAATVQQSFLAGKGVQAITFPTIPPHAYGDPSVTLSASSSSGLIPTFALVSGPATVVGTSLTITGVGTVTVMAAQSGNGYYFAAPDVTQSFAVNKANQTIAFSAPANHVFGDAPFALSATATSGLGVTFALTSGPATISGNTVTITGGGTVQITASQPGNANFNVAANVVQSFIVNSASQTVSFGALTGKNYGDAPFAVSAAAPSGLPVSFSIVSGPATVSGNTVSLTGAGLVMIAASQGGNSNYSAATNVNQSFIVAKVTPSANWGVRSLTTSTATYTVTAGDLNASFSHPFNTATTTPPSGTTSYSIVGPGTAVTAGTALNVNSTSTIRASYPGDLNYLPTIADAAWSIVPPPPSIGSANSINAVANQAFSFQATASFSPTSWTASGLPAGLTINSSGLISGTTTLTGTFNVTLTATNAGGSGTQALTMNVYLQPSISSSLNPTIKLNVPFTYTIVASGNPTAFTASGLPPGLTLNGTSGVISGTPTNVANYPVAITAANSGASTPATLNLNVAQTYTLTISANPIAGGSSTGAGVFDPGTPAPINAVPAALYRFGGWGGADGGSVANSANASSSIVMSANRTLQAIFIAQANVTVNAGAGGNVSGSGVYDIGSNAPISATPNAGYYFNGWSGVGVVNPLSASSSVSVPGTVSVMANFASLGSVTSLGTITFANAVPPGQTGAAASTSQMTATVTNNGSSALNVTNVTTSGDFSPNVTLPFSIPSGGSVDVPVVFAPSALGTRVGMFTLASNDSSRSIMLYNLQGTGSIPNQPPTVTITAPVNAYSGSPLTVSSVASAPNSNLTLHSIESMSPSGSWTVNVVSASGGNSTRTVGVVFPVTGSWTLRAGASTDGGTTWIYSSSIVVGVSNGLINYDVQTMAVPNPNMQMWYVPSAIVEKQFQIQRTNP